MALSQVQCLDDNHVNPRTHESKPEFLYCEDQRLALEVFLRDGREAFVKYMGARGMRGFLSDPELETLAEVVEPYDPGSEVFPENAEDDEPPLPLSLHYWPELSDTSIPHMDLGWPDTAAYRGVTRTTVYTQPPLEGQVHIKEVVRKMIAQAQKVIAVVMDMFTDVDIFRDLLDAGFKRKVSVYILLERTTLPHFRSMCQRANMHAGHLKHLRVRCTDGTEFYTRSCTKVRGRMGHRFMFVDGDKAVSGSYSFTWISSRLDKSLITVVTGQAVEAFDRLFRILYATSSSVDLRQVATEPAPEPEPLSQPASVVLPSDAIARKLYSPKYALVTLGNPSPTPSADPKENKEDSKNPESKKRRRRRASKEAIQEAPPLHPGLTNLEKACLISYLPTWPEPDPPSDVIGFINVRDTRKPTQVHLQRSEMFETSQAIRFSSPFSMPKEILPEVAKPRQFTAKQEEINKLRLERDKTKAEELLGGRAQPTQLNSTNKAEAPGQKGLKFESDKDATLNENKQHSNTPANHDAHTPRQSSSKASSPNTGRPSHATPQTVTTLPGSNTKKETNLNTQCAAVNRKHATESSSTQEPHLRPPTNWHSNTEPHTQTKMVAPHADSHTRAVHTQPQNTQTTAVNSHTSSSSASAKRSQSVSSTSTLSENSHVSVTTITTTSACSPLSSISSSSSTPPLTSSSTTPNPPLPSSSASPPLTSTPPVPKPRTVQLVIKGGGASDGQKLPEVSVVRKPEMSTVVHNVATVVQTSPEKVPETVPTGVQKDPESMLNVGEAPQQKQSVTSQERKNEEADERQHEGAGMQLDAGNEAKSDVSITDMPKTDKVNIQETIPKHVEPKTLTSTDCKLTTQIDGLATVQTEIKAPERAQVPNETSENVTERKIYLAKAHALQRISYSKMTPQDIDALETIKAPTNTPVSATHASKDTHTSAADTQGQQSNPSFTPNSTDSMPNPAKHNSTFQVQVPKAWGSTLERPLRLHLPDTHVPDFRSPTPERESGLLAALMRSPTPDGFPPHMATPDSHTPDPRSYTPDFQTPTSDGYASPGAESVLSTTSDEYYECCDSPLHEPVFAPFHNHGTTEDHISFTNTPNATTVITSPAYLNSNTRAASLGTTDTSSSETQSLSGPASVSSLSSLLERKVKMGEETDTANEENWRDEDEEGRKAERRTEGGYQETERRGSKEDAKRTAETEEKIKMVHPQIPKRKKVLNQSAAEKPVDRGVTPNERTEPKRLSTGDLQPKKTSTERKRPDKEKAVDRAALGSSGAERRERPRSTDRQKLLNTPPRTPRGLQQDSAPSSPSRPSRPPRPLATTQDLGSRPLGSRQLNHTESKVIHGSLQALNNISSPRRLLSRPPSRPPPPATAGAVGSVAGRRQAEVSHSHQSLLSRQPPAAQSRARAEQSQNHHPYPKPPSSFLHTHTHTEEHLQPHSQKQTVSQQEAHWQEEGKAPFSFTFSKLYNLRGLKDKMSKLPAQSKRSSASSPRLGRKSTS